jgi:hypothetical protein
VSSHHPLRVLVPFKGKRCDENVGKVAAMTLKEPPGCNLRTNGPKKCLADTSLALRLHGPNLATDYMICLLIEVLHIVYQTSYKVLWWKQVDTQM